MLIAWFYKTLVSTLLLLLSSPTNNARIMVLSSIGIKVTCNMLRLLTLPNANARNMVLSSIGKYHAPSVVIA